MSPKLIKRTLFTALNAAAGVGPNTRNQVFLNSMSGSFSAAYPAYKVDQKHSTRTEKLYDICIYKEAIPEASFWPSSKLVVSEVFAAIEIENRQGPVRAYEDMWKVVFSRATHRVFCGGIEKTALGRSSWETLIQKRMHAIEQFYGAALVRDMIVAFYPTPRNWTLGVNHAGFVSVHQFR